MNDLVKLTIDYGDGHYKEIETMVVTKESNAYATMLAYAEQNDYAIAEEPYYNEKHMQWVLRGILSTNAWEQIDSLYDAYLERCDLIVDDRKPSRDMVLDKIFEYFTEDAKEGERRNLWLEINQYIEKEKQA
jgi:hypothetical protein